MKSFARRHTGKTAIAIAVLSAGLVAVAATPALAIAPTAPDAAVWGVDGRVRAVLETPTAIYLGGSFTSLTAPGQPSVPRANIAALDPATGAPLPWNPGTDGEVWDFAVSPDGQTVYAAGGFKQFGGVSRGRAAAFSASTGAVLPFNPKASALVEAVAVSSTTVYLGGQFAALAGVPRTRLAAVSPATGAADPTFTATADGKVHDLQLTPSGTQLLVAGNFDRISGGSTQHNLASLDPTTGAAQSWSSRPSDETFNLTVDGSQVFAAVGGSGGHVYAYTLGGSRLWEQDTNGDVHGVAVQNGVLYVGGHFTEYDGDDSSHLVAVSPSSGNQLSWSVNVNSKLGVWVVTSAGGHLSVGGDFTRVNAKVRSHYARFSETP